MTECKLCSLPESEHYYDRAAWGCRGFDGIGDHPYRPPALKSNFFVNGLIISAAAGLLYLAWVFMS